jgi:hypothetical protein
VGGGLDPPSHSQSRITRSHMGWAGLVLWCSTGEAVTTTQLRRRNRPVVAPSMDQERGDVHAGGGLSGTMM